MRTGFGVVERSRFFRVDLDRERLSESGTDWPFIFFESFSALRFTLSFDFGLSLESFLWLRADPLLLRFEITLLSRRWSLLDDDDELELDEDEELEELDRDAEDELLSDELFILDL